MHARPFLLPASALVLATFWLVSQRRELGSLERSNQSLTTAITRARAGDFPGGEVPIPARPRPDPFRTQGQPDWQKIAQAAPFAFGGQPDMRTMVALQKTVRQLTPAELIAGLEEIRAMDLSESTKKQLELALLGALIEKDPQLALERFGGNQQSGFDAWQLSTALGKWSAKDPAAATAWLDAQIAAGALDSTSLDGKNPRRLSFEAALMKSLLANGAIAVATARVTALPENQRADLFSHGMLRRMTAAEAQAAATLIRSMLPKDKQYVTLLTTTSGADFSQTATILRAIDATPQERADIVSQTLRQELATGEPAPPFEETRAWIATNAPANADSLTGQALAHLTRSLGFEAAAKLALQENNDATLATFLHNAPPDSHTRILELADRISDPDLRESVNRRFLNNPVRISPAGRISDP